jgi:parvulin-like peptidyl-prolyl isomerase
VGLTLAPVALTFAGSEATPGAVVATVNGQPIHARDLEALLSEMRTDASGRHTPDQKKQALDRLVEQELLYQKAMALGYDKDPRVRRILERTYLDDALEGRIPQTDIGEQEARAWYREHKADYDVPEMVRAQRIFVRIDGKRDEAQARATAERLRAMVLQDPKSSFKKVAQQHSEDPNRDRGGDTGLIVKGRPNPVDPIVEEKAFSMQEGTLSEVFRSNDGFNVLHVTQRRPGSTRTFAEVKALVIRNMKEDRRIREEARHVEGLRKSFKVEVDDRALESADAPFQEGSNLKSRSDHETETQ